MIGPYINGSAVIIGGIGGAALGTRIPERVRTTLPLIFGACSMGMGIVLMLQVKHLPAMVLSVIVGAIIGELIYLERGISKVSDAVRSLAERFMPRTADAGESKTKYLQTFVAIVVLFCASGTGIFGAMKEGMTGDSTILIAKSFLDLFTAGIFATSLGFAVAAIAIPQVLIQLALAHGAVVIMPLTTPMLIADFSAVGGVLMLATGFRICGIKTFPVANMLPALLLAMPISHLWTRFF
jgi:uncharacterized membrane protein YqgA involved in biofilm formation